MSKEFALLSTLQTIIYAFSEIEFGANVNKAIEIHYRLYETEKYLLYLYNIFSYYFERK